jgi:hypothetical protein
MSPTRRSTAGLWPALLFLLHPLSGCRVEAPQGDPSLLLELAISPTPPAVGPVRLIVSLQDTLGNPMEGAEVRVEGNMTHAGMVPIHGTAQSLGQGTYVVPDFRFTMAGDWVLTVTATLPDGRESTIRKSTDVVGPPVGGVP